MLTREVPLGNGRSAFVTLRKGGVREASKLFKLEHDRFFLYPTFDHQRSDLVRESHRPELRRALEEGVWADGEPPAHALTQDGGIAQPDRVRIRAVRGLGYCLADEA